MPAPRVRGDYSSLSQIAKTFAKEGSDTRQFIQRLKQQMETLRSNDWVGQGANAFYKEMDTQVMPALNRLANALERAGQVTAQMSQIIKTAEDEAAACFRGTGSGGGSGSAGSGGGAAGGPEDASSPAPNKGTAADTAAEVGVGAAIGAAIGGLVGGPIGAAIGAAVGGAVAGLSGDYGENFVGPGSSNNPYLVRDANGLFTDQNMKSLIGTQYEGANSQALNNTMSELLNNPSPEREGQLVQQLADLRGRPVEQMQAEYDKYKELQQNAERIRAEKGGEAIPALNTTFHGDFMGSTSQLRYGQVVGDAFGIDPVFGAMLNPTGGLVGPGNMAFDAGESAVGYHGVVHDAAGYLYNYQNAGPGYNYLGREDRDTSSPFSGQRAGIEYWRETMPGPNVGSTAAQYVMDGFVGAIDTGSSIINRIKGWF